jgi:hypothetical protein
MTMKSILLTGALALSSVAFAGTKSYNIVLTNPTQAGSLQLKAGEYSVKLEGSFVVLTNLETTKSYLALVRVASGVTTYDRTAVETTHTGDQTRIKTIELEGTDETLEFGE